jgi:hypothetical protein
MEDQHMQITEDKWTAIVAETQRKIDKWNAHAAERKTSDTFRCDLVPAGEYVLLMTTHDNGGGYYMDRHAVAYKPATQEMKPAKPVVKKGRVTGFQIKSDPKAWASFADKSADEIVKQLKLTGFVMVLGASVVRPPSGPPLYLVQGWHRQDHTRRVAMVVAIEEGRFDAHAIAEQIAGPEICFNCSSTIGVLVPPEHQGVLFEGDQLYDRVPELRPRDLRRRTNPSPSAA